MKKLIALSLTLMLFACNNSNKHHKKMENVPVSIHCIKVKKKSTTPVSLSSSSSESSSSDDYSYVYYYMMNSSNNTPVYYYATSSTPVTTYTSLSFNSSSKPLQVELEEENVEQVGEEVPALDESVEVTVDAATGMVMSDDEIESETQSEETNSDNSDNSSSDNSSSDNSSSDGGSSDGGGDCGGGDGGGGDGGGGGD